MTESIGSPSPRRAALQRAWAFFLWVAFPIHAWAIYFYLINADRYAGRSNWEAVGLGGYILLIALIESLLVTGFFLLLGLLLPRRWPPKQRQAARIGVFGVTALWLVLGQVTLLRFRQRPGVTAAFFAPINQPSVLPLLLFLLVLVVSIALPIWAAGKPGLQRVLNGLVERVSLLSWLYLALDVAGLVVVIIRNL
ncbi:MAG: hypothetical protein EPO32_06455 [Anaerolineae bacterium]|nr:MAG: hypothetical protein EPO32_06455 [Anaerolineae bacterium]